MKPYWLYITDRKNITRAAMWGYAADEAEALQMGRAAFPAANLSVDEIVGKVPDRPIPLLHMFRDGFMNIPDK